MLSARDGGVAGQFLILHILSGEKELLFSLCTRIWVSGILIPIVDNPVSLYHSRPRLQVLIKMLQFEVKSLRLEFKLAHLIFVNFHTPQSLLHIAMTLQIFQIGPSVHQIQTLSHLHFRVLTLKLLIFGISLILLNGSSEFLADIFPLADLRRSIFLIWLWSTKFVVVHFLVHCVVERVVDLSMVIVVRRIRVVSLS